MPLGSTILGGGILGGAGYFASETASPTYSLFSGYRLELRNPDNERLAVITEPVDINLKQYVNEPAILTFSIVQGKWHYESALDEPNHVALFDRAGVLQQVFEIVSAESNHGESRTITYTCSDRLILLNDDCVQYSNTNQYDYTKPFAETVAEILALQTNTRKVKFGSIDAGLSGITKEVRMDWETPLAALHRLRDAVGGFFWIDADSRLHWRQYKTARAAREIRWKKNLMGFKPVINNDSVITHLRYFGKKERTSQVGLPDPGYLVSSTYEEGQRKRWHVEVDQDILFQSTLEEVAAIYLSEYERPDLSATVRILDLSQSPKYNYDEWYGVGIGDQVKVYHPALGSDPVSYTVVSRSVDLAKPLDVELELGRLRADIQRIIADVRWRQRRRDRSTVSTEIAGLEDDPEVFEPPGSPDTIFEGVSDRAIRSDAILPILPGLGYIPEAIEVGDGAPGTGPYAAPQDHSHPLDPLDLLDPFGDAGFITDDNLGDYLTDLLATDGHAGLESQLDNEIRDWTALHGVFSYIAPSRAELPTEGIARNSLGFITATTGPEVDMVCIWSSVSNTWFPITHWI